MKDLRGESVAPPNSFETGAAHRMSAALAELLARCKAAGLSPTAEGEALHVDYFGGRHPKP
jgi:hypothetical protein